MAKYSCWVTVEFELNYEVEAESEEQAKELAEEMAMRDEDLCDNIPDSADAWKVERIDEDAQVKDYFDRCKNYWTGSGDTEGVATSKAFWWDCVECWNADKSWTPAKEKFAKEFRNYKPGDPVPDSNLVAEGGI